ncbi:MAG: hypothetical protein ACOC1K_05650 [Nanoarchaeota archaeon]
MLSLNQLKLMKEFEEEQTYYETLEDFTCKGKQKRESDNDFLFSEDENLF